MPDGPGIVSRTADTLHIAAYGLIGAGVILVVVALLMRPRRTYAAVAVLIGAVAVAAGVALVLHPAPTFANAYGIPVGGTFDAAGDNIIITAAPRESFVYTLEIVNTGVLPVRVLGVVKQQLAPAAFPDWQSVAYHGDARGGLFALDDAQPLEPFDLQPGEFVQLNLSGLAGGCAAGTAGSDSAVSTESISLAYQLLGLESVTDIALQTRITEPQKPDCALL